MRNEIAVVDIGSRYGIHPTWRGFEDIPIHFFLIEADRSECDRLSKKYSSNRCENRFSIIHALLASTSGPSVLLVRENSAMSGTLERVPSRLYSGARREQESVETAIQVSSSVLDDHFSPGSVDFLKLDTEGSELDILKGAERLLKDVLGVRLEVSMNRVFKSGPLFSEIDAHLRERGFALLNLDYDGRGDLQHSLMSPLERYGVLNSTDAVYVRDTYLSYPFEIATKSTVESVIRLLRVCLFLVANRAMDLCLALLEEHGKIVQDLRGYSDVISCLHDRLALRVERHFYGLKWIPNQDIERHIVFFREVFGRNLRTGTAFMSSIDLNP